VKTSKKFLQEQTSTILIVDDHPLVRLGIASLITSRPELAVYGEAASASDALEQIKTEMPDLIIVDIQLGQSNGIELVKEVDERFPEVKILVVSTFDESLYAERSLRAGADGYVNKRELQDTIIEAILTILDGERYLSDKMTQNLVDQAIRRVNFDELEPVQRLSDRELEVFQLIGHGHATSAIAMQLGLSVHTIDSHREKIRVKLGIKNGTELMHRAILWILQNG
jgi:DNA-binding NarL/FixJ family response regulator